METVQTIMSTNLFTLKQSDTLDLAQGIMSLKHIRHIPIVDDNHCFIGLITHRDLLRVSISALESFSIQKTKSTFQKTQVRNIMQKNVMVIHPDTTLKEAAAILLKNKFGCLPIVAYETKKLVGIITEADFVRFAAQREIQTSL